MQKQSLFLSGFGKFLFLLNQMHSTNVPKRRKTLNRNITFLSFRNSFYYAKLKPQRCKCDRCKNVNEIIQSRHSAKIKESCRKTFWGWYWTHNCWHYCFILGGSARFLQTISTLCIGDENANQLAHSRRCCLNNMRNLFN